MMLSIGLSNVSSVWRPGTLQIGRLAPLLYYSTAHSHPLSTPVKVAVLSPLLSYTPPRNPWADSALS